MATKTRTIGKTGADYSTMSAWAADEDISGGHIWKGVVIDAVEYNENISISDVGSGITNYVWLTVAPRARHTGVPGTGARIRGDTTGTHVIDINSADFVRIEWLEIQQDFAGDSLEGIRIDSGMTDALISYCIIWSDIATVNQDGIYWGTASNVDVAIDNCIFYGWTRAGVHSQNTGATPTITATVDHCAFFRCGVGDTNGSGGLAVRSDVSGITTTFTIYNCYGTDCTNASGTEDDWLFDQANGAGRLDPIGTTTWNGTHNAHNHSSLTDIGGTDNMTNWVSADDDSADTDKTSGEWIVLNNITTGSEDLSIKDNGGGSANVLTANGTNRQGSEPDARQDFGIDIQGNVRPTSGVDIGPAQQADAVSAFDFEMEIHRLEQGETATDQQTYATGTFSPTADTLIIAMFHGNDVVSPTPTATGGSLTWTICNDGSTDALQHYATIASPNSTVVAFWADSGSSPGTFAVTVDWTETAVHCMWSVAEVADAALDASAFEQIVIDREDSASGTASITLSTFADTTNRPLAAIGKVDSPTISAGLDWEAIHTESQASPAHAFQTQWQDLSTDLVPDWSWGGTEHWGGFAIELAEGGGAPPTGTVLTHFASMIGA